MNISNDFRIIKLDRHNITWERLREVVKKDKTLNFEWVQDGGFYTTIQHALNDIIRTLINEGIECEDILAFKKYVENINLEITIIDKSSKIEKEEEEL